MQWTNAILFGFLGLIVGGLVHWFFISIPLFKVDLPEVCGEWNKNHVMEVSLFATGFFSFLAFTGIQNLMKRKQRKK